MRNIADIMWQCWNDDDCDFGLDVCECQHYTAEEREAAWVTLERAGVIESISDPQHGVVWRKTGKPFNPQAATRTGLDG